MHQMTVAEAQLDYLKSVDTALEVWIHKDNLKSVGKHNLESVDKLGHTQLFCCGGHMARTLCSHGQ
jgi:hypothetical protein